MVLQSASLAAVCCGSRSIIVWSKSKRAARMVIGRSLSFAPRTIGGRSLPERRLTSPQQIERTEDRAVERMRHERDHRGEPAVVHGQVAGWLEQACRLGTAEVGDHARMNARQQREERDEDDDALKRAEDRAEPPGSAVDVLEEEGVDDGEKPAV